ncbi:MAG TPA: YceI family protein [Kofleriaceae bacterium]|nr:YceI family protein [Kofleriaceae bacterium]
MPTYRVDGAGSALVVRARSSVHDTDTRFDQVTGSVEADPAALETAGATARFEVHMASFDAGDWLKNRKLKKDLELDTHPTAQFELRELREVTRGESSRFEAVAVGVIRYRGRELPMEIRGSGTMDEHGIDATGSFDVDIRAFGMQPPKILMFKIEPEVTIEVTLRARAS